MARKPLVSIYSFGFHYTQTIEDPYGHGGYVFDCRQLPNPGRQKEFKRYSGLDEPVVRYLEDHSEVHRFYDLTYNLVKSHCQNFSARGLEHLMVSYGCTGGQHRSVYMAERLERDLRMEGFEVSCTHIESFRWDETFSRTCTKAFILAAGLGTRLFPLTKDIPKALVKVGKETAIDIVSQKLIRSGIKEIVVNIHHLSEQMKNHINSSSLAGNFRIIYEPELLDTGGSLRNTEGLWGEESFFIHNVDIISETDLTLLYRYHLASDALATLVVQERNSSSYFIVDSQNMICGLYRANKDLTDLRRRPEGLVKYLAFSGIHAISPNIFKEIKERGKFSIVNLYLRLIEEGFPIHAYIENRDLFFADIGKPEGLQKASQWISELTSSDETSERNM